MASRTGDLPKTNCGYCARCGLRRGSGSRSSGNICARSGGMLMERLRTVSAERIARRIDEDIDGRGGADVDSSCWTKRDCSLMVLPEMAAMKGVEQPPQYHPEGDVWTHTLLMLEGLRAGAPRHWRGACCCTTWASHPLPAGLAETGDRIRFDGHVDVGVRMARGDLPAVQVFERGDGTDRCASGEPHAV